MPKITVVHIVLLVAVALIGVIAGWIVRGSRAVRERRAVNAGWQEQVKEERSETERLSEQSKYLMDQNSQSQASSRLAMKRAKDLSDAMQEAYQRRNDMRRKLKAIRSNLETAVSERDELKMNIASQGDPGTVAKDKDDKIFQLSRELDNWQKRLPPLIERYRVRDEEAIRLEADLAEARAQVLRLEESNGSAISRVEPVLHPEVLTDGHDASNDTIDNEQLDPSDANNPGSTSRDDLQQIKGIGPAIEKTLNEMGITRFHQIAGMSEYDINRVAERLKGFHTRIYREDWIGQARELEARDVSA
jgi:predicted flap endonuclease-1-like 5' DNA nuclease